ncbi:LD-carboxypeptidase [Sphingorhabdus wooponensis]|jgi:muramoyltetrapeptide carboxypeptidase|uniref:LD-carboxypeptidase n=1 Tax=Sphingorhabdus wooponensis TaxID=940136 RepID=A0A3R8Q2F6_9SPHN|nr:LD-carboxypeptidase [Sphingorhabdus wooponensis]RRQ51729.1 LD-carboxypeptidase [Sphingorhabdus wooponensis]
MRIAICAPSTPFTREDAARVSALAATAHPTAELVFHDQCFAEAGHFAGLDDVRCAAFVDVANDPSFDAVWFVRGGYGACRIAQDAVAALTSAAADKIYMGYSDAGNLLGALYGAKIGRVCHGPMPADIRRDGGEAAVLRALNWMLHSSPQSLEPHVQSGTKYAAFNLMTLAMIVGTPLMPDLKDHVLMVEEVSEYLYGYDRAFFHVTSHLQSAGLAGLRLGRVSDVPENDRPFGEDAEEIAQRWCAKMGIKYLGRADIGHDADNRIVPFGLATSSAAP